MQFKLLAVAVGTTLLVAACGGSSDPAPAAVVKPTSLVSFGDSLSDVGTYKVGTVLALTGGTYSVNGITTGEFPSKNWTELLASSMKIATPTCAAQTGLDGQGGFSVPVQNFAGCFNYAQGGARVTNTIGPGNKALGGGNATLGQLTVPIVTQIANHLTKVGGSFSGTELVTVMAGGNDAIMILGEVSAVGAAAGATAGAQAFASTLVPLLAAGATNPATAASAIGAAIAALPAGTTTTTLVGTAVATAAAQPGNTAVGSAAVYGPMVTTATTAATNAGNTAGAAAAAAHAATNGSTFTNNMAVAAKELATYIKTQIVGKGAKYVLVVNLPDLSSSPLAATMTDAQKQLPINLAVFFNTVLESELTGIPGVRVVDSFTALRSQVANPAAYGLTNATSTACNLNATAGGVTGNGLADSTKPNSGTSLVCNASNTLRDAGGAVIDVSKYLFADSVHPTPYGYKLLADLVTKNLTQAGWL